MSPKLKTLLRNMWGAYDICDKGCIPIGKAKLLTDRLFTIINGKTGKLDKKTLMNMMNTLQNKVPNKRVNNVFDDDDGDFRMIQKVQIYKTFKHWIESSQ